MQGHFTSSKILNVSLIGSSFDSCGTVMHTFKAAGPTSPFHFHNAGERWLDVHDNACIIKYFHHFMVSTNVYMFSWFFHQIIHYIPFYGQHKCLYVFLFFPSDYTLYAQYKRLYVSNYTHIIPTHRVMHI